MLKPNHEYELNGNHYFTDHLGRVDWWYGHPIDQKAPRDFKAQRDLENKEPGENAGHIIAARHNGYGAGANLVRQDQAVNQRDSYIGNSNQPAAQMTTRDTMAPDGIHVTDTEKVNHDNIDKSVFEDQPENDHWAALAEEYDNPNAVIVDDHNQIQTELAGALTDDNLEDTDGLSDTDEISLGL